MRRQFALFAVLYGCLASASAQSLLSGTVTSAEQGKMEGVVVSAKKVGSIITVSVVTNEAGRFSFPAGRLDAGRYDLRIRATGYELEDPKQVEVSPAETGDLPLKLRKVADIT